MTIKALKDYLVNKIKTWEDDVGCHPQYVNGLLEAYREILGRISDNENKEPAEVNDSAFCVICGEAITDAEYMDNGGQCEICVNDALNTI